MGMVSSPDRVPVGLESVPLGPHRSSHPKRGQCEMWEPGPWGVEWGLAQGGKPRSNPALLDWWPASVSPSARQGWWPEHSECTGRWHPHGMSPAESGW